MLSFNPVFPEPGPYMFYQFLHAILPLLMLQNFWMGTTLICTVFLVGYG